MTLFEELTHSVEAGMWAGLFTLIFALLRNWSASRFGRTRGGG